MTISDILVYADPTASSAERLAIAFRLAHRFEAYLIGVVPEDAAMVGERFEKTLLQEAILGEWHMAIGLTEPFVTRWAHCADLVILGQRIPDHDTGLYRPEDVILSCSRPVLVVPYAGRRPDRPASRLPFQATSTLSPSRGLPVREIQDFCGCWTRRNIARFLRSNKGASATRVLHPTETDSGHVQGQSERGKARSPPFPLHRYQYNTVHEFAEEP